MGQHLTLLPNCLERRGVPSEGAGYWVLLPAVHCRSQAQGNLRTLWEHDAGESCTCYFQVSTLELEGRALPSCTMSPALSDKASMAAGKEKSKGPKSTFTEQAKGGEFGA